MRTKFLIILRSLTEAISSSLMDLKATYASLKRVIGLPGDIIDMKNGIVYLNNVPLTETYIKGKTFTNGLKVPFTVPANKVFVMGDNRESSQDSRELGPIAMSSLEGRAIFRLWPLQKFGQLE